MENLTETKLTSDKIYSGCILDFYRDTVRLPNGGTAPRELIPLGPFYPAAAYSDEVIWMYLARGLTFGEQQLDDDEFLNLQAVPLEELARDVLAGRIPDAKTQAAILRVYCMERGFEPK